jgi:ParB/Sulfiredoxin domain
MRTGLAHQDAQDDFDRARRRAAWAKLARWLHGRPSSYLPVLGEAATIPGEAGSGGRRLEYERVGRPGAGAEIMVPIEQIVGTVEPTKSRCFDSHFRPTSDVPRKRFERIATEIRSGRGMDPVELYRCGGQYYVLDGHHRIAVARALGERSVWATITEVRLNDQDPDVSYRTAKDPIRSFRN